MNPTDQELVIELEACEERCIAGKWDSTARVIYKTRNRLTSLSQALEKIDRQVADTLPRVIKGEQMSMSAILDWFQETARSALSDLSAPLGDSKREYIVSNPDDADQIRPPGDSKLVTFMGIEIVVDPTMPPNAFEIRYKGDTPTPLSAIRAAMEEEG